MIPPGSFRMVTLDAIGAHEERCYSPKPVHEVKSGYIAMRWVDPK